MCVVLTLCVAACRYVKVQKEQNFAESQRTCQEMGGNLASVHSKKDWDAVKKACDGDVCYIGAHLDAADRCMTCTCS